MGGRSLLCWVRFATLEELQGLSGRIASLLSFATLEELQGLAPGVADGYFREYTGEKKRKIRVKKMEDTGQKNGI